MSPDKIKVTEVSFGRETDPVEVVYKFSNLNTADAWIRDASYCYPKTGYVKHYVKIKWADGETYSLRVDVKHAFSNTESIISNLENLKKYAHELPKIQQLAEVPREGF